MLDIQSKGLICRELSDTTTRSSSPAYTPSASTNGAIRKKASPPSVNLHGTHAGSANPPVSPNDGKTGSADWFWTDAIKRPDRNGRQLPHSCTALPKK